MNLQMKYLIISFLITVILGLIVIPILKKLKIGQVVRDDGPESHLQKSGTPTMGGIIMLVTIVVMSMALYFIYPQYTHILPIALITLGFGIIGFIDDFKKLVLKDPKGLLPRYKMLGLLIVAVVFTVYLQYGLHLGTDIQIPFLKNYITLPIYLYIPFAVIVILACTNSLNLTDGLDGLATGITILIMTFFTIVSVLYNNLEMSLFSSIVAGSCIGFLLFNLKPAKVFMGDTGSLALGGAFCAVALYLKMPFILIIVAGICVLEALSVIIQVIYFKKTGNRFFKMSPLHHHFELSGYSEWKVVWMFWIATIILCLIGFFAI
ncbi:MAG: phospho-N-acetylmuramoyl-pentapeptide-transferase [Clostridiales bacterium]|nr:phospho-N-acetylmuramoyl-pentapeptide-transferase [Clostridiales bacterium]